MIFGSHGTIRFMTEAEHLQYQPIVLWDEEHLIRLTSNKQMPFMVTPHHADTAYVDLFALRFGHKEQLKRRIAEGWISLKYGCHRAVRDEILLLPPAEIIRIFFEKNCFHQECQYWSHPTGIKSKYAINCILARYMAMSSIDLKCGLTLEEVSRVFKCTRERIRQIEEKAMRRMRHRTRMSRFDGFQQQAVASRAYTPVRMENIA